MTTPFKADRKSADPVPSVRARDTRPSDRPQRSRSLMRKYEVASLATDGSVRYSQHIAPATATFEGAFSAFARGTMLQTSSGPCAIEDLVPGDHLLCADGTAKPVTWIGSMTMVPSAPVERPELTRLTRIMADTFGLSRPMPDLVCGPGARLFRCPAELRGISMQTQLLTPVRAFVDGINVIEVTPPAPVTLYHLCLPHHAIIRAAGLEVETYHPGPTLLRDMGVNMKTLYMSLFPHLGSEDEFGPLVHPRAGQSTLDSLSAA
ncbi:Hint domain-containing protein [Marimonas lutisalis]|uniref:Hint domain-containing protein n=1 Tax=Marimonas lutisalis TaxID=2545756 RepID=UPI001376060C|nr:Hint domain-containing protein [Marimonas lutisalis]